MRLRSSRPERRRRPAGAIERTRPETTPRRALVVLHPFRLTPRRNAFAPSPVSLRHRGRFIGGAVYGRRALKVAPSGLPETLKFYLTVMNVEMFGGKPLKSKRL